MALVGRKRELLALLKHVMSLNKVNDLSNTSISFSTKNEGGQKLPN